MALIVWKTNSHHRCRVRFFFIIIFIFILRRGGEIQHQPDIWSCSFLWTVVRSLSLSFFICSLLFTFSWHVSFVNRVAAAAAAAELLIFFPQLQDLLMSNYGCVFIVTAPCLCWTVALLHRRVLSASPKLSHSNLFFSLPFFFLPRFTLPVSLLRTEWVNWPLFQSHGRKLWWLTGTDIIFLFNFFPLWPLRNSKCKKKCCFFIRILNKANIKKTVS